MVTKYWAGREPGPTVRVAKLLIIQFMETGMQNQEGRKVPQVTFRPRVNNEWASVTSDDIFSGKTVVVFSLPGAFTPTCSSTHLPRYNELAPAFFANGVDSIV